jgi:quinol monooxygenase YgiN
MSEPVVFTIRFRIKQGKADEIRNHYQKSVQSTFKTKPDTFSQLAYEDEGANVFTVIRTFPNAHALDQHFLGADERSKSTFDFVEPYSMEIYGAINPATLEKLEQIVGPGVTTIAYPNFSGGFIR